MQLTNRLRFGTTLEKLRNIVNAKSTNPELLVEKEILLTALVEISSRLSEDEITEPLRLAIAKKLPLLIFPIADRDYDLAFRRAASMGDIDFRNELLPLIKNINGSGATGKTALHVAAENLQLETVEFLLRHGAYPNMLDKTECNPLKLLINQLEKNFHIQENVALIFKIAVVLIQFGAWHYGEILDVLKAQIENGIIKSSAAESAYIEYTKVRRQFDAEYSALPSISTHAQLFSLLNSYIPIEIPTNNLDKEIIYLKKFFTRSNIPFFESKQLKILLNKYQGVDLTFLTRLYSLVPETSQSQILYLGVTVDKLQFIQACLMLVIKLDLKLCMDFRLVSRTSAADSFFLRGEVEKDHSKYEETIKALKNSDKVKLNFQADGSTIVLVSFNSEAELEQIVTAVTSNNQVAASAAMPPPSYSSI